MRTLRRDEVWLPERPTLRRVVGAAPDGRLISSHRYWIYLARMQVTDLQPLPLLVSARDYRHAGSAEPVLDDFVAGLAVVYVSGPPYDKRLLARPDLDRLGWSRQMLRRRALETLDRRRDAVRVYGQPPARMLSFEGLESSLLLAGQIWDDLAGVVPGDVVVGVPARDVVIVTGTRSPSGLARVRRAVDRMFFAHHRHPLSGRLLVRRGRSWEALIDLPGSEPAGPGIAHRCRPGAAQPGQRPDVTGAR